jgi:hypothetical protein
MNSKIHAAIEIWLLLQPSPIPSAILPNLRPSRWGDSTILTEKANEKGQ